MNEDVIRTGESPQEYRQRLLRTIQSGNITDMDNHDRVHGALAYIDSIRDHYTGAQRNINLVVRAPGNKRGVIGHMIHSISGSGTHATVTPLAMGSPHKKQEQLPIKQILGLQLSSYPNLKAEHRETLRRLMDFRGLQEMKEYIKQLFLERRKNKDCGCNQLDEAKEKKPYKGFKKGKNHPEGGLSRAEAKRQGIHAGIETKDEAKRKGGFNKLSKKTQSRRKSFCARMCGMKRRRTSSKTARDPKSKINAALRVWGCRCGTNESYEYNSVQTILEKRGSCWEGYKQEGMKSKNGKMVPNCVPVNESITQKIKDSFIKRKALGEEVVNRDNKGTMSKKEIKRRDTRAKNLNTSRLRPIKGDTEKEMKYRVATFIELAKRGKKGKKKSRSEKQED
jgi:hypothetical protein